MSGIVNAKALEEKRIFLVLSSPAHARERDIEIIKEISSLGYHTIIISTNFPYSILIKLYRDAGVDPGSVSFIDSVTRTSIGHAEDIPGVVHFINNPGDLTDLGIAVTEALKDQSGKKVCILYDSISTMLIYLSSANISKFIHFVTNKLRLMRFSGIFIVVEKGLDPDVLTQLTMFVDTVIDMDKNS